MTDDVGSDVSPDEESEYARGNSQMRQANFAMSPIRGSRLDQNDMARPLLGDYEEKKMR